MSTSYSDTISAPAPELHDAPTESHLLAVADHDEKGAAQEDHSEPEVKDLGWHDPAKALPKPLVAGLSNEDLWLLIRRFNKQLYHVKSIDDDPPGGLDLHIANEEEFSPDKLRCNFERLYMTVIIGMMGMGNHIVRLRSWRETRRTTAFCVAYFVAWTFGFLSPLIFSTMMALIVYPPARSFLFPPVPLALVDRKSGGIQNPRAGMLGSHDSMTGAPERHKGEAVELEAHNFVSGFASVGLGAAMGNRQKNKAQDDGGAIDKILPDATNISTRAVDAKGTVADGLVATKHDKTKQPTEVVVWEKARPFMRALADVADVWEVIANALSPTKPFKDTARVRLGSLMIPAILAGFILTPEILVYSSTFLLGAVFFGDPILTRGLDWLNRTIPNWASYLDLRNTILIAVPTSAQLTLTLLRIGEANRAPLPPPPPAGQPPPAQPLALHGDDIALDASHQEVQEAIHPGADYHQNAVEAEDQNVKKPKSGHKFMTFLKSTTRAGVKTILGTDRLKASAGDEHAKMRLGIVPDAEDVKESGPVEFSARYHGKKGYLYLSSLPVSTTTAIATTTALAYVISFSTESTFLKLESRSSVFQLPVADIVELKKIGGLGWKGKLVVGWALERELADGLEIVDRMGHTYTLTAIPLRDELFNRLIAIGGQKWESW